MPTAVLTVENGVWSVFDPGAETVMGFENTDSINRVVVVIDSTPPTDPRRGSEIGHTIQPKDYRDFNFKTGEKAYIRAVGGRVVVTAL